MMEVERHPVTGLILREVGSRVDALFQGRGGNNSNSSAYFAGKIEAVNEDGSYFVLFDNKAKDEAVLEASIDGDPFDPDETIFFNVGSFGGTRQALSKLKLEGTTGKLKTGDDEGMGVLIAEQGETMSSFGMDLCPGVSDLTALVSCKALMQLSMQQCDMKDAGAESLAGILNEMPLLSVLNISQNNIGADGGKSLASCLVENTVLNTLDISMNDLRTDGGAHFGGAVQGNSTLTALNISDNDLDDEGCKQLCLGIEANAGLKILIMAGNIRDVKAGGPKLMRFLTAAVKKNDSLRSIDAKNNGGDMTPKRSAFERACIKKDIALIL
jgi:hypothetical protein